MKNVAGIMGLYVEPGQAVKAASHLRSQGYKKFDFHTPFPIHGLDQAMGVRKTILPWISLVAALTGTATAIHLQWWTGAVDFPLIIGGKPFFAVEPSIPVIFELSVLLCAIGTAVAMFALNGLPKWYSKWQHDPHFLRATDDAFVVTIDAEDPQFHAERTVQFLESIGAKEVRLVENHEE